MTFADNVQLCPLYQGKDCKKGDKPPLAQEAVRFTPAAALPPAVV